MEKRYALIGRSLQHSNSPKLFKDTINNPDYTYELCEVEPSELSSDLIRQFDGCNVTIPYKKEVIKYLDELDDIANAIQSVNCIENKDGKLIGHNTDFIGITTTLDDYTFMYDSYGIEAKAIIFGNGGVSPSVQYYFKRHNIKYDVVGRSGVFDISYNDLKDLSEYNFIVNTTPVGMYPNINDKLDIPYETIKSYAVVFDLIYNPEVTEFMKECSKYSNHVHNGSNMLIDQAIASYIYWGIL